MTNNQQRIHAILDRWFKGQLSASDRNELNSMSNESGFEGLLEEALRQHWNQFGDDGTFTPQRTKALADRILSRYPSEGRQKAVVKGMWFRLAKYAAILFLIIGSIVFWNRFSDKSGSVIEHESVMISDIHPGSNKAVLTLSDRKQVMLDAHAVQNLIGRGIESVDGSISYKNAKEKEAQNTLTTPRGGQYQVVLQDGTRVWLNAASSITYPVVFAGTRREVTVDGEVYFEVAKDKSRPFVVHTGTENIEVLGTHFNVNFYNDEPMNKTSLLEGSIKIGSAVLQPGEAYSDGNVFRTNTAQDVSWKNGLFNFQNQPLVQVMRQLSRWYDVDIVFEKTPPDIVVMGEMGKDLNLSEALEILSNMKIRYRIEGRKLTVLSN